MTARRRHRPLLRHAAVALAAACCCLAVAGFARPDGPSHGTTIAVGADGTPEPPESTPPPPPPLAVVRVVDAVVNYPTGNKNFAVMEAFSGPETIPPELTSPFLLAHHFGTATHPLAGLTRAPDAGPAPPPPPGDKAEERIVGWHPHRGFDILSYMKEGRGSHADSLGNVATVRPGGLQWMHTGSGIEHAEGGGNPDGVAKHGFQLWIDTHPELRMQTPQYGTVQPEDVPEVHGDGGGLTRILGGSIGGRAGGALSARDDFAILDCELPPGTTHGVHLPARVTGRVLVFAYRGKGLVGGTPLSPQQTGIMSDAGGAAARLELVATGSEGFGALVFAGAPIGEPIAWRGPIVMNTDQQIRTAFDELRSGSFLKERAPFDYRAAAERSSVPYEW